MRPENASRRSYIQLVGGVAFGSSQPLECKNRSAPKEDVSASDLLVPQSHAPTDFEVAESGSEVPLFEYLASSDLQLDRARTGARGYWKGPNEQRPNWVLSSLAVIASEPISRRSIEDAVQRCYSSYVRKCDAETPEYVDLTQSRTLHPGLTDWRMVMRRSDSPSHSSAYLFKDVMRLQYRRNVLLGTGVFGPDHADRGVDSMLTRFSRHQRSQLQSNIQNDR